MVEERIGVVGVGLMGHGMAKNLLAAGFPVVVIAHRNRAPVEDLVGRGAIEVGSLEELARSCRYLEAERRPVQPARRAVAANALPRGLPPTR